MIDKSLVKKRFKKSLKTYNDNAIIQKQTADKLITLLPEKNYNSILEIGCATGILSEKIKQNLSFNEFSANDLVEDSQKYVEQIIPSSHFIAGDIEEIQLDKKYDLIISNACLQWCSNIIGTIDKLKSALNPNGVLALSVFGDKNLAEIKNIFEIENKMYSMHDLSCFENIIEDTHKLYFDTPIDVLKHLKLTGVNAIKETKLTKSKLKEFEMRYKEQYFENGKVYLTYNPVYIVLH